VISIIIYTAAVAAVVALFLGLALGVFKEIFHVEEDPLIGMLREALPGANCGGCGFPGCDGYASAVAGGAGFAGGADITKCTAGGKATADKLAGIMGVGAAEVKPLVPVPCCLGGSDIAVKRGSYSGLTSCRGAKIAGGTKLCSWGCIGFGDCVNVCKFGALSMGKDRLPVVNWGLCTGCKVCVAECPQGILKLIPKDIKAVLALCSNRNTIRSAIRKTCRLGCIKCGICVKQCPEQCIVINSGIPIVDYSKCTACGTCEQKCPTKVMRVL
jgi:Na+-translocating ferredoxin:NAD+ oxidoreductase RNF subunit RnfB